MRSIGTPRHREVEREHMAEKKENQQTGAESVLKGIEMELASAVLDIVRKLVTDATKERLPGKAGLFPNGIGLFEIQTSIELSKITLSARIADVTIAPVSTKAFDLSDLTSRALTDGILSYCISLDAADDPVMTDCNAFVKKVGANFGVAIPDLNADGIVDSFGAAPFSKTTMNPGVAMSWAKDGLVLAGMKMADLNPTYGTAYKNGHVAVVHSTEDAAHPGFPMASWGALGGRGHANRSIRQSFPARACDDSAIHFAFAATT
jgi:hypothetical protein